MTPQTVMSASATALSARSATLRLSDRARTIEFVAYGSRGLGRPRGESTRAAAVG